MLAELDRQEPGRIGAQCDRQHALVRGSLDSRNVDGDLARAAGLAREPRAVLRGAGALEHVQLVFTRWAKRVCALAHDHAARRAGELAAAIVSERSAAFQQAVQKDFAFAQGDGEVIHLYQTAESAGRSGRDHPPNMDSCTSKFRCTPRRAPRHHGTSHKEASMSRTLISTAISILAAIALGACSEKAPRPDPEGIHGTSNAMPQHPMYERTVNQGESERMGN